MVLTCQIKLLPTKEQEIVLEKTLREYISLVNDIVDYAIAVGRMPKLSSASVHAPLPSALRDQCRLDANGVYRKCIKTGIHHILKKPVCIWNNQNYKLTETAIEVPAWYGGRSRRISIKAIIPSDTFSLLTSTKLGTLRLTVKNGKHIAQVAYTAAEASLSGEGGVMGVDLGLKCPAVCMTDSKKVKFVGNGRKNRYVRRYHTQRRKKLGKAKKLSAIRKSKGKEERYMRNQDHKMSRAIVDFAKANGISTIRLEELAGIRAAARKSRKNNRSIGSWSFYRLAAFIEYKAALAGIRVEFVNPRYTSQRCPACGKLNHADDRSYTCSCGVTVHRDIVGAMNIISVPVSSG